jgi:DNA invertase Pin-like site-specific DNA recombinase
MKPLPINSAAAATAYSYVRFSTPDQARGDSLRRQTEAPAEWCLRNHAHLDTTTTFRDLGKSAFTGRHRTNPDRHALAAFLRLVEAGKVSRGSYLIIENLDRLSREEVVPATHLLTGILVAGVRVVQLAPAELVLTDKSDPFDVMRAVMELSRGHGESAIKSDRVGKAWAKKRELAREHGQLLTHRLPAWVEERDGKLLLIPDRAAVVRRIFQMSTGGYGLVAIVKRLTAEGVPAFGTAGHWGRSYVGNILKDRRALGELQPRRRDGTADGPPIPSYFPAVVGEAEWWSARAGAAQRRKKRGRIGSHVNVFAGLLRNARDGGSYYAATRRDGGNSQRVLLNMAAAEGRAPCWSFPFETFEKAVLVMLREIDPAEVLGTGEGPNVVATLTSERDQIATKAAELEAELLTGNVAALARALRQLEERAREVNGKLAEFRQAAARPLDAAWRESRTLLAALEDAPDPEDVRLRLRAALRRMIESVAVLVTHQCRDRLAAVQVWFAGGTKYRLIHILHRPPRANALGRKAGRWWVKSTRHQARPGGIDLRSPEGAAKHLKYLQLFDPAGLTHGDLGDDPPSDAFYDYTEPVGLGEDIDPDPERRFLSPTLGDSYLTALSRAPRR